MSHSIYNAMLLLGSGSGFGLPLIQSGIKLSGLSRLDHGRSQHAQVQAFVK
jgi:hypothetical protein